MTLTHEHVLVTGAAGFIGSHVVDRLLGAGASVTGVDNFDPFYAASEKRRNLTTAHAHRGFRFHQADCTDLTALEHAISDRPITAIIHLAAKAGVRPSIEDPIGYAHANVVGTQVMLEFARRRLIGRILFASSSSVYGAGAAVPFDESMDVGAPISPYAATKRAGELLCSTHALLHGAAIIALRFFTVYGPRQRPDLAIRRFATRILARAPLPFHGDGSSSRDYTWIGDIVDGVVAALRRTRTHPAEYAAINLGGSRTTTLIRLVELLEDALEVPARLLRLPVQPGDVPRTHASTEKANRLLGYSPQVGIEDGIPRFADWLLAHEGHAPRVQRREPAAV